MWTTENRGRYDRSKLRYPSDLTDEEWALVATADPAGKRGGNKRHVDVREVVNGLMYVLSTGCQWRAIPKDLPPRCTVLRLFRPVELGRHARSHPSRALRQCREQAGREASPTAADHRQPERQEREKGGPASIRTAMMRARRSRARSGISSSIRRAC